MNPARKRTIRLVVALTAAVTLASALIYTSFSAASPAISPSQLIHDAVPGRSYQLTGTVVAHSINHDGEVLEFRVKTGPAKTRCRFATPGKCLIPSKKGAR